MKKGICIAITVIMLLAAVACLAQDMKAWRVGVSYARLTDSDTRDALGDGWAVAVERSFGDTFALTNLESDLSAVVSYKFFDDDVELRDIFAGLKWRFGPGAKPACDGLYGGVLAGAAFLRAEDGVGSDNDTNFEWGVLGGMNFARDWYAELAYNDAGDLWGGDTANFNVTVGYRF